MPAKMPTAESGGAATEPDARSQAPAAGAPEFPFMLNGLTHEDAADVALILDALRIRSRVREAVSAGAADIPPTQTGPRFAVMEMPAAVVVDKIFPAFESSPTVEPKPKSLDVLLAEDDDADAYLITAALMKLKRVASVMRARDGVEAMHLINSGAITPHLAIVDLHMPRKNGFTLLLELACRDESPFPCAVLTSSIASVDHIRSKMRGAFHVLTKPESIHEMESALQEVVSAI